MKPMSCSAATLRNKKRQKESSMCVNLFFFFCVCCSSTITQLASLPFATFLILFSYSSSLLVHSALLCKLENILFFFLFFFLGEK